MNKAIEDYQLYGLPFHLMDMIKYLVELKEEYPYLKEVDSQCLQQTVINLGKAFAKFFKELKKPKKVKKKKKNVKNTGFPNFKKKYASKPSARFTKTIDINFDNHKIKLPKFGWVNFYDNQQFDKSNSEIKNITLCRNVVGEYYVSVLVDVNIPIPLKPEVDKSTACGVDVNEDCIVVCDGNDHTDKYYYPEKIFDIDKSIKYYQKELSGKVKGSNNYNKTKQKISKLNLDKVNCRKEFLNNVSTQICKNQTICVETLSIESMVYQSKYKKSRANLYNASWRYLFNMLEYKSRWLGLNFIKISQWYASSKTCHVCGTRNAHVVKGMKHWTCRNCGTYHDRDINASINIKYEGLVNALIYLKEYISNNANPTDRRKFGGMGRKGRRTSDPIVTLSRVKSVDCYPKGRIAYL